MVQKFLLVFSVCSVLSSGIQYNQNQRTFKQAINHFHRPYQEQGEFNQTYWVVDDFWDRENGPVFLYICGEYECPGVPTNRLFPLEVAKNFKAKFVVLEHRYYGNSLPYNYASMLPQLFFYLDVQQAMADTAEFIVDLNQQIMRERGQKAKVVIVGGSYAGAFSAWFRTRYPQLVDASWASSAVVVPYLSFPDFDKQVYLSAMLSGKECVEGIKSVNSLVEEQYKNGNLTKVTEVFDASDMFKSGDGRPVLFYVTDVMAELIQYGHRTELCSALSNAKTSWEKLAAVATVGKKNGMTDPKFYSLSYLETVFWKPQRDGRQWYWQKCTQLGWFQTPSKYKMRSELLNMTYWKEFCNAIFEYPGGLKLPNTLISGSDLNYKGTKIVYTYGMEDPWQWAGNLESDYSSERPVLKINCTDCAHCVDLYTPKASDSEELKQARQLVQTYLSIWLNAE